MVVSEIALARYTSQWHTFTTLTMQADMLITLCMGRIGKMLDAL